MVVFTQNLFSDTESMYVCMYVCMYARMYVSTNLCHMHYNFQLSGSNVKQLIKLCYKVLMSDNAC